MKKSIIAATLIVALTSTSMAFAVETVQQSKMQAFHNVKTKAVSDKEMNQVSGQLPILIPIILGVAGFGIAGKIANKIQCGTWSVCKAR